MALEVRAAPSARPAGAAPRYVRFVVGDVDYAIKASAVRCLLPAGAGSSAERTTIDLRTCFRVPVGPGARPTLVVEGQRREAGLLIDAVVDVACIEAAAVQDLPAAFGGAERHWFQGLARVGDRLVVLIDVDGLLS